MPAYSQVPRSTVTDIYFPVNLPEVNIEWPRTQGRELNLCGSLGRSWDFSPKVTHLLPSDKMRAGWAVAGSRITFTAKTIIFSERQNNILKKGRIILEAEFSLKCLVALGGVYILTGIFHLSSQLLGLSWSIRSRVSPRPSGNDSPAWKNSFLQSEKNRNIHYQS